MMNGCSINHTHNMRKCNKYFLFNVQRLIKSYSTISEKNLEIHFRYTIRLAASIPRDFDLIL